MNKRDFVDIVAKKTGLTKEDVQKVVDEGIATIIAYVPKEDIRIEPLGKFKYKIRAARKAPNPQTGGTIEIPERMDIVFKPSKLALSLLELHVQSINQKE